MYSFSSFIEHTAVQLRVSLKHFQVHVIRECTKQNVWTKTSWDTRRKLDNKWDNEKHGVATDWEREKVKCWRFNIQRTKITTRTNDDDDSDVDDREEKNFFDHNVFSLHSYDILEAKNISSKKIEWEREKYSAKGNCAAKIQNTGC